MLANMNVKTRTLFSYLSTGSLAVRGNASEHSCCRTNKEKTKNKSKKKKKQKQTKTNNHREESISHVNMTFCSSNTHITRNSSLFQGSWKYLSFFTLHF